MLINTPLYMKTILIIFMMMSITLSAKVAISTEGNSVFTVPNSPNVFHLAFPVGNKFTIKIRGNPSTGYGWYLVNANQIDTNVLKPLNLDQYNSAEFVSDPNVKGLVGVGGYYYFKFLGKKSANSVKLIFVNKRPWETQVIRTVKIYVKLFKSFKNLK